MTTEDEFGAARAVLTDFVVRHAALAAQCLGSGWRLADNAPDSCLQLRQEFDECRISGHPLRVATVNVSSSTFLAPEANWAMRFWGDVTQAELDQGFGFCGESRAVNSQLDALVVDGLVAPSVTWRLLFADTTGQNMLSLARTTCVDQEERQRRHEGKWMKEVLDGLDRIHQVVHALAADVHELAQQLERQGRSATGSEPPSDEPKLLSIKDLAGYLGISSSAAYGLRHGEPGLVPVQIGKRVYFRRQDVERWLDQLQRAEASAQSRYAGRPFVVNRIGSSVPESSDPPKRNYCNGSGLEPARLSRYAGRGVCPVCGDDPLLKNDGRLRKHLPRWQ